MHTHTFSLLPPRISAVLAVSEMSAEVGGWSSSPLAPASSGHTTKISIKLTITLHKVSLGIENLELSVLLPEVGHIVLEEYGVHSYRRVDERDIPVCIGDHVEASYSVLVLLLLDGRRVDSRSSQSSFLCDFDRRLMSDVGHHEVEDNVQAVGILIGQALHLRGK